MNRRACHHDMLLCPMLPLEVTERCANHLLELVQRLLYWSRGLNASHTLSVGRLTRRHRKNRRAGRSIQYLPSQNIH